MKKPIPFDYKLFFPNVCPQLMTVDGLTVINEANGLLAAKISASRKMLGSTKREDPNYTHPGMILIIQFYCWNNEAEVKRRLDYSNTNEIYMGITYLPTIEVLMAGDESGNIWCYDLSDVISGKLESDQAGHQQHSASAVTFPVDGVIPFPVVYQGGQPVEELKNNPSQQLSPSGNNNNSSKTVHPHPKMINMLTANKTGGLLVAACTCNILCLYTPHENLVIPDMEELDSDSESDESDDEGMT